MCSPGIWTGNGDVGKTGQGVASCWENTEGIVFGDDMVNRTPWLRHDWDSVTCSDFKDGMLGWTLSHSDWCPCKKWGSGHRHTQRHDWVRIRGEDGIDGEPHEPLQLAREISSQNRERARCRMLEGLTSKRWAYSWPVCEQNLEGTYSGLPLWGLENKAVCHLSPLSSQQRALKIICSLGALT